MNAGRTPCNVRTVRRDSGVPGREPGVGHEVRFDERGQDPVLSLPPGTGPGGEDGAAGWRVAGAGPGVGHEARFDERGQDPMLSLPPGTCPGGETGAGRVGLRPMVRRHAVMAERQPSGRGKEGVSEKPRNDPMQREDSAGRVGLRPVVGRHAAMTERQPSGAGTGLRAKNCASTPC